MATKLTLLALVLCTATTACFCRDLLQKCNNAGPYQCPECDWNAAATKTLQTDGSTLVTINSCLLGPGTDGAGGNISFISFVPGCEGNCTKQENVPNGGIVGTFVIPAGSCTADVCIYVHDGKYKQSPGNMVDLTNQLECIQSVNQRCALCNYKVTFTAAPNAGCNDNNPATCNDVCLADGTCAGKESDCGSIPEGGLCGAGGKGCGTCVAAQNGGCGKNNVAATCAPYDNYITGVLGRTCSAPVQGASPSAIENMGVGGQCAPSLLCCGYNDVPDVKYLIPTGGQTCADLAAYQP